jgi:hypothetical protein
MQRKSIHIAIFSIWLLAGLLVSAAQQGPGILGTDDVRRIVPPSYFFRGRSASVQLRNSAGFRTADDKLVLAGLVDTSGYASNVAEKYQGFLITEVKLNIEGSELPPGEYGFGFSKQDKFTVMDVGSNDLLSVSSRFEENLTRPVPLIIVADQTAYRLYVGRKWVVLKAQ